MTHKTVSSSYQRSISTESFGTRAQHEREHFANIIALQSSSSIHIATWYAPALLVITLGGFALRLVLLDAFPFREDEAAYAYWALHGWLEDPYYLRVWPDKPPVFLWALGAAFQLFGVSEASARFVNIAASTLTIAIVAATARRLWGRTASIFAALVFMLSPYAISFAPTAYTDPLLVLFGMSAFCAAIYGRATWAGVCSERRS